MLFSTTSCWVLHYIGSDQTMNEERKQKEKKKHEIIL